MEDQRCCGSGTCIINAEGLCWCGQQWDGNRMSYPANTTERSAGDGFPEKREGSGDLGAADRNRN